MTTQPQQNTDKRRAGREGSVDFAARRASLARVLSRRHAALSVRLTHRPREQREAHEQSNEGKGGG